MAMKPVGPIPCPKNKILTAYVTDTEMHSVAVPADVPTSSVRITNLALSIPDTPSTTSVIHSEPK